MRGCVERLGLQMWPVDLRAGGHASLASACGSAKEVRAALNVASDWGYIEAKTAVRLDRKLDEVCTITWCLGRNR